MSLFMGFLFAISISIVLGLGMNLLDKHYMSKPTKKDESENC